MMERNILEKIKTLSKLDKQILLLKIQDLIDSDALIPSTQKSKKLIAFVNENEVNNLDDLKNYLKNSLPNYMVPTNIIAVEEFPLLPNGKIDRNKTAELITYNEQEGELNSENNVANTEIEQKLITIWEDVLGFSPIRTDDNFFEIGGDSILSIQIVSRAKNAGIPLSANQLFEHQTISELASAADLIKPVKKNKSVTETLTNIWEEVLNFAPVRLDDNFFEIGGDSILSIQIIAKARKAGINLKANQIFDHQTIAELSEVINIETEDLNKDTSAIKSGEIIPLTPIQHWFFESHQKAPHYWNQIFEIQSEAKLNKETLQSISKDLVLENEALRLCFFEESGKWLSKVKSINELNPFIQIRLEKETAVEQKSEIEAQLIELQDSTNLSQGNLFRIVVFNCNNVQKDKVFVIAHHLVVDMVSWSLINNYISSKIGSTTDSHLININSNNNNSTIKDWSQFINNNITQIDANEMSYWESQFNTRNEFPTDYNVDAETFAENTIFTISSQLSNEMSENLIFNANKTYNTKTEDLLITALLQTFKNWSQQESITLGLERQARTIDTDNLDFSETVGWFTSYFPQTFKGQTNDIENHIKSVKEQLRAIPNNGIGFGILKYLSDSTNKVLDKINPRIVFNYLGKSNSENESSELNFSFIKEHVARHPESEREYEIEINTYVLNQTLIVDWSFTRMLYKEDTAKFLIENFMKNLESIIEHCISKDDIGYTPSDFTDVDLNQDDLDNLLSQL